MTLNFNCGGEGGEISVSCDVIMDGKLKKKITIGGSKAAHVDEF